MKKSRKIIYEMHYTRYISLYVLYVIRDRTAQKWWCEGVKSRYTAKITAPSPLTVLMSAVPQGEPQELEGKRCFSFKQRPGLGEELKMHVEPEKTSLRSDVRLEIHGQSSKKSDVELGYEGLRGSRGKCPSHPTSWP